MISSIAHLVYVLPYELPSDLRLKKIFGKSQIWVETQPSAHFFPQKLNFGDNSQETRKSRYQTFLAMSSSTGLLHPIQNIPPKFVVSQRKPLILTFVFCILSPPVTFVLSNKKIIYHLKRNWSCFSLPKFCHRTI